MNKIKNFSKDYETLFESGRYFLTLKSKLRYWDGTFSGRFVRTSTTFFESELILRGIGNPNILEKMALDSGITKLDYLFGAKIELNNEWTRNAEIIHNKIHNKRLHSLKIKGEKYFRELVFKQFQK